MNVKIQMNPAMRNYKFFLVFFVSFVVRDI
jgi:hypothetical protein